MRSIKNILLTWLALAASTSYAQVNVVVQRGDNARTGENLNEASLTTQNVNASTFGKLYAFAVDGHVYAQPLYVSNLSIPGLGTFDVVFVATQHDGVYAFDAATAAPIWYHSFIDPSRGITSEPASEAYAPGCDGASSPSAGTGGSGGDGLGGGGGGPCGADIYPELGITSTPVIDTVSGTMYVVAKTNQSGTQAFTLHALDIATGADKATPAVISASVPQIGGGTLTFNPAQQGQRPGLVLVNGVVYVGFGSLGDFYTWQGWLIGYNATTLARSVVLCLEPDGSSGGGLWSSGEAPPVDSGNNLYVNTGNGNYDGARLWGDSFLKLSTAGNLAVTDWFTPFNQSALNDADLDVASAGQILLPDSAGTATHPHILVGSGKDGTIYVLDRDNMGHYNASYTNPDAQIIQEIPNALGVAPIDILSLSIPYVENSYNTPTFWNNNLYWCAVNDVCKMFTLSNGKLSTAAVSVSSATFPFGSGQPVISTASGAATSAILWQVERDTTNDIMTLHAYDATNLGNELYNSNQAAGGRDVGDPPVKWVVPTVANGRVIVGAEYAIDVYGLLSSKRPVLPAPTFTPASGSYSAGQSVVIADSIGSAQIHYTLDGSIPTLASPVYSGPIQVNSSTTINAIAVASGYVTSPLGSAAYRIGAGQGVVFVQSNYSVPLSAASVILRFPSEQIGGDLNVVVVGWNDSTTTVTSVTDSLGNIYQLAAGPTVQPGVASQAIYYASNIAGAAPNGNAVTVNFSGTAFAPDIRILEYGGIATTNALDVVAAAQGSGTTASSGTVTTTNANDLIIGANVVQHSTLGAGAGFTNRILTVPDSDLVEDEVVTTTGSYAATAPISGGGWVMQMAAFEAANTAPPPTPSAPSALAAAAVNRTQVNLTWGASTEAGGTIAKYLIERCQGAGCSSFAQVGTATATAYSDTGLSAATSYSYRVRAQDTSGNNGAYSNVATTTTQAGAVPTAPTGLTATAAGPTQANLTWGASSETGGTISQYLIERCQGTGCSSFVQVATSAMTSFSDTALAPSTTYRYRVRAQDTGGNTGSYSNVASTTTAAPTITAPTGLAATAAGAAQVNLGWGASSETGGTISQYLIERCQGTGCSNFAQVGTSASTSYGDVGLTGSTAYSYRVRAQDTLGNNGPYSNVASATTAAPTLTAPTNLTAAAISNTQISLGWGAASETGGTISQYLVERCQGTGCSSFVQVGTANTTAYSDTGLSASTAYSYRVRATDAGGNLSGYSNVAGATTTNTAPQIAFVQGNSATPSSAVSVAVKYTAAQGAGDLAVVIVGWNTTTTTVGSVTDTSGNVYALAVGPTVQTGVASQAIYYASNIAAAAASANTVTVTFTGTAAYPDIRILEYSGIATSGALDVSAAAQGSGSSASSGTVTTTNANDLIVGANLVQQHTVAAGSGFTSRMITVPDADLAEDEIVSSTGNYAATSTISGGAWIMQMAAFKGLGMAPTPSAPTGLAATATSGSQISLTWGASSESGGTISQYLIERCKGTGCSNFAQVGTSASTSFGDVGLTGSTSYSYRVRAQDSGGNNGPYSSVASATTQTGPTPTAPTGLAATAAGAAQVNLGWGASSETGGTISQYLIERCQGTGCSNFAQVGTSASTSYGDVGLTGSTAYSYRVRAQDTLGNNGPYSNVASATTAAPTLTAPTNLTAAAISNTQISLGWGAASETGGTISQYLVERCQGTGCSSFVQVGTANTTAYSDTGLSASTAYSYRVRATDAGGNLSGYSNVAGATTTNTAPQIAFVQGNSATPSSAVSVAVKYTAAQGAGDLAVVIVGWNNSTTTVGSVTDTSGNVYALAVGPTVQTGVASQAIYYASNIAAAAASANTVTVTFTGTAAYPDIRILEYSGIATSGALDVSAAAQGSGSSASSGTVATTNANDLIVGANLVQQHTVAAGSGFTSRMITVPDADLAEDEIVSSTGNYAATSTVSGGAWIMQMAAFKRQP